MKIRNIWKTALMLVLVAALNFTLLPVIGYQAVGFIFLLAVLVLSLFVPFAHIVFFAVSSALIWNFFFIPPHGTFFIEKMEDLMMNAVYIIASIITGYLTSKIRKNERLLALKEAREGFFQTILDSVSHEMKTPVTSIIGIASALNAVKDENERGELTEDLVDSADRLDRIVTNLLDMSRLSSGDLSMKKDWQEVSDVVEVCLQRLREKLARHKIKVDIEEDLPLVRIDLFLFEQALSNVVLNAANYAPAGTEIKIRAAKEPGRVLISVLDNGPGIKKEELSFICNKFYRAEGAPPGGTGLGLAIARGVVEAHGGTIEARNREAGGLEIKLSLPAEKQPELKEPRDE